MSATVKRLYDAAKVSDFHVVPDKTGQADYVTNHAGRRLLDYARWLDENSDVAISILDVLVNNIVGTGIAIEPQVTNRRGEPIKRVNDNIRAVLQDWSKYPEVTRELPWGEWQRLSCRTLFRDGEVFAEHIQGNVRANRRRPVPYSIRMLESDWVPYETFDRDQEIIHGIQKDPDGMPATYYFYKSLGNQFYLSLPTVGDLRAVPEERIEHLKFTRRLNQTRGVSVFHGVINRLDDIKDMEESERVAARIAAAWTAAIVRNPDMVDMPANSHDAESGDVSGRYGDRYFEMGPGTIWDNLLPGEDIKTVGLERPNNNLIEYLKDQHRRLAGGTGTNASSISKNYDGSYSSQRQELVEAQPSYARMRDYFVEKLLKPVYERFNFWAVESGAVRLPRDVDPRSIMKADYRPPAVPWIDPQKEMQADVLAVENRFKSRQQVIRERGYDPELVDQQIMADMEATAQMGLNFGEQNVDSNDE